MGEIHGECAPRFARVREAFEANFDAGRELGASFAATLGGELVVDLWGGYADAARTRPWQRDTIVNVFSTTKAMAALCAHMLVERGQLDLDAPVAKSWPEFAQEGKGAIPVHCVLSHRAGLAAFREPLPLAALYDWARVTSALAAQAPWWEPGSASGYHALSFGHLVGELARRVDGGRTLGRFFREEVAQPLGVDFHIGLPASEDGRVAELLEPTAEEVAAAGPAAAVDPDSLLGKVLMNPPLTPAAANTAPWRRAEIPAANGHGNARSVAQVLGVLAGGGRQGGVQILGSAALERATSEQSLGPDLVLPLPMRWGLGFMLTHPGLPLGPNPRAFGHGGWGGSLGIADPDARLSWAYVMNKMSPGTTGDTRGFALASALYASL
jgi:CubicO group peptidase (beta-lactamase class C family)